jgi:hypothetical protein
MSPPGRPKGEYRSAQREGTPVSAKGHPEREHHSAQHDGRPVRARADATGALPVNVDAGP